jgi:NAD(P)-dependent dehydrogenase (short-subunit alcohol dehydrogenase family)
MANEPNPTSKKPVCAVVGVGPGNGAALARRFAQGGYAVALLARKLAFSSDLAATLPDARAFECDVSDAKSIEKTFVAIREQLGDVSVVVYNAGSGVWGTIEDVSAADFENAWRVNALGAFLTAKEVVPFMKREGRGSFILIGATASRRGGAKTAAFASAKSAQRTLAESMARHLWPSGIHVALIIVDGVVDLATTRKQMPGKPDSYFVKPDELAETAFHLTEQKQSAWSFEVEARPFGETW